MMNAIDMLKTQHREMEELFNRLSEGQGEIRQMIFDKLADLLAVHTAIEERIFYPATRADETDELLDRAVEEHLAAKRLLVELMELDATDPAFDERCKALEKAVMEHVDEEERHLLPHALHAFGIERLEELGEEMELLAEDLRDEGEPRLHVPTETGAGASV